MYKKNLHIIYKRLIAYYHHIENVNTSINIDDYIKTNYLSNVYLIITYMNDIMNDEEKIFSYYYDFLMKNLKNYKKSDNTDCVYIEYTHVIYETTFYKTNLKNFLYFMCFIHDLYIHTLGKKYFLKNIEKYLNTKNTKNIENFEKAGWNVSIIDEIIVSIEDAININYENYENKEDYIMMIFTNYTKIANDRKIINKKIIEKIFNQTDLEAEIFHIIYTKIDTTYEQYFTIEDKKKFKFKFFEKDIIKNNKNYIRILEDSNNKYINVFTIEDNHPTEMA